MISNNKDGSQLEGEITLLQQTSKMTELFNDKLHISRTHDQRLQELDAPHRFLMEWKK